MRGRVLAALCLCALFSLCAAAETETDGLYSRVESIFADAFFEEVGKVLFSQSSAVAGNRVASLKMNGDVYVYDAETGEYSLLCSVPVVPKGTNAPYAQLDAVTRSLAGEAVFRGFGHSLWVLPDFGENRRPHGNGDRLAGCGIGQFRADEPGLGISL